jgi:hypothetical protein
MHADCGVYQSHKHRNVISRMRIRTVIGFFTVQSNSSLVEKGKKEKN